MYTSIICEQLCVILAHGLQFPHAFFLYKHAYLVACDCFASYALRDSRLLSKAVCGMWTCYCSSIALQGLAVLRSWQLWFDELTSHCWLDFCADKIALAAVS